MFATPTKPPLQVFAVVALGAAFVLFVVVAMKRLVVGESIFNARRPFPARPVDPFSDRFLIRDVHTALSHHLEHTCLDVCGLSAIHLGLPLQLAVIRTVNKQLLPISNPRWIPDRDADWKTVSRLVGPSDPMCRKAVVSHNMLTVATKIRLLSLGNEEVELSERDARCAQQLIRSMNMNSSDDWPCVLSDLNAVEFLPLYFR